MENSRGRLVTCVSNVYTRIMAKDVGLRIRVDRDLRESFTEACKAEDRPAAQVIREFMRAYVLARKAATGNTRRRVRTP